MSVMSLLENVDSFNGYYGASLIRQALSEVLKIQQRTKHAKLLFLIYTFGSIYTFQYLYQTIILVSYSCDFSICRGTFGIKIIP